MIKSGLCLKDKWRYLAGVLALAVLFALAAGNILVWASENGSAASETETVASETGTEASEIEALSSETGASSPETEIATADEADAEQGNTVQNVSDDHEVPEGVSVSGVDIGGMTVAEAEAKLEEYVAEVCGGTLTLTIDGDELTIAYADFDMQMADSTVIQEICEIGSSGNLIKRYKELADVKNNKAEYTLPFEYDEDKLSTLIEEITADYNREAENATLVRTSGEFQITEAITGLEVDVSATVETVAQALGDGWDGSSQTVAVIVEETEAEHTEEELETVTDLLGSYSTSYSSSGSNRRANIARGAELINGIVLYPGETFSFLSYVLPFSSANGYYEANSYAGGKVVESLGGGICQVSTTLYNAVLRAELEVVSRSNHGLTVSYVPLAADATVSESGTDFQFKNDMDTPIYIQAYTSDGYLYINIYGQETRDSSRTIEFKSVTEQTLTPGDDVITEDDTLPEGYEEVTQSAHTGYVASLYKYVYINGELQDTILINTSTYRATPRYVTVGTKVKETEAAAASSDATSGNSSDTGGSDTGNSDTSSGDADSGSSGSSGSDSSSSDSDDSNTGVGSTDADSE